MELLKYKEFSASEAGQLSNLSFCAGGNLRKSASNRRVQLRNKQSEIYTHNFFVQLKNFCIKLQTGKCESKEFVYLSDNLNLHKKNTDQKDYKILYHENWQRIRILKQFIQNHVPFKYLKMYHYSESVIYNSLTPKN